MPDITNSKEEPFLNEPEPTGSRWFMLEQPRVQGFATFEWNAVTGTTWFSEEWENIIQSPYDWTKPSDQEWWSARVHPEDKVRFQRSLLAVYAGLMEAHDLPCRLKRGDGAWRQVLLRSRVTHKTSTGGPRIIAGLLIDLTDILPDIHNESAAMTFSNNEYHSMLENSPDLFIRFDRDMLPVYVSPSACRFIGGARGGRAFKEETEERRIAGNCSELFRNGVEQVFKEQVVAREELTLAITDGSEIVGDCSFWPEFDAEGNVKHCMMQFRDITDIHYMVKDTALNEKRLELLHKLTLMENVDEAEVFHFAMDSIQELTQSNGGFFFMPTEPDGDRGQILWARSYNRDGDRRYAADEQFPDELLSQLGHKNGKVIYRGILNNKKGEPFYASFDDETPIWRGITAPVIENGQTVFFAGVCNKTTNYDETDQMQFETFINSAWLVLRRRRYVTELQLAKEKAEAATNAMSEFIADVNHELRSPISSILVYAKTMVEFGLEDEDFRKRAISVIHDQAGKMHRLVKDLLDLSRIDGTMPLELASFDLAGLAGEVALALSTAVQEKNMNVDIAIPRGVQVNADRHYLFQVFRNLIENACRYAKGGTSIKIQAQQTPEITTVSVSNQGDLIAKEELERIFERFYRAKQSGEQRPDDSGIGVGLSICRNVVERHGGSIWAENTADGVVFNFTLQN